MRAVKLVSMGAMPRTLLLAALLTPLPLLAQALAPALLPDTVVARRGGIDLDLRDVDVKVRTMPAELRAGYLTESDRAARMIDSMLLNKQLAERARELGIDKEPGYLEELQLAASELLSRTLVERHVEEAPLPEVEGLARERYMADPESHRPAARIDVSHILIATDGVDEAAAKSLAEEALKRGQAGESLDELAKSLGDGSLEVQSMASIDLTRLDPAFVRAVGQLKDVGDLTGPVRSRFGYHVIRLDLRQIYPVPEFEMIKPQLIESLRGQARDKVRRDFLASFSQQGVVLNDAVVSDLRTRYLPTSTPPAEPAASEGGQ